MLLLCCCCEAKANNLCLSLDGGALNLLSRPLNILVWRMRIERWTGTETTTADAIAVTFVVVIVTAVASRHVAPEICVYLKLHLAHPMPPRELLAA